MFTAYGPVERLGPDLLLYDLAQIRGVDAVLNRIPDETSGVYAWYRRFDLSPEVHNNEEAFTEFLLSELQKPHSAPRGTRLPPAYRIALDADTSFSKEEYLRKLAVNASFRTLVLSILDKAILFQQPFYIGKAIDLQKRIQSHLREASPLRQRLRAAGHNLDQCRLLLILTASEESPTMSSASEDDEGIDLVGEPSEQLLEDILSRLFLPTFTLRYG